MSESDLIIALVFGMGFGIFLFVSGFFALRKKKLIENMPTSKIRSLAMGLVEIKGKVMKQDKMLTSRLEGKKCFYYKSLVERYVQHGKSHSWVKVAGYQEMMPFFLKDDTDDVMVDPEGAKIDLPPKYFKTSRDGKGFTPALNNFCKKHNIKFKGLLSNHKYRFQEWRLEPDERLYIMGTAGDNPYVDDTTGQKNVDDIIIHKGKNEKYYFISTKGEKELVNSLKSKVIAGFVGGPILILGSLTGFIYLFTLGWI